MSTNSATSTGELYLRKSTLVLIMYSEEQKPLEDFFDVKGLKTRNEMTEDVSRGSAITCAEC